METRVTREAWLIGLVDLLKPYFSRHKEALPSLRITCGWTGKGVRTKRVGECWAGATAADSQPHIYISPVLEESVEVAAVVVHELIHIVVGTEAQHGKLFRRVAVRLGLEGPMRSTVAGKELKAMLTGFVEQLGPYPHAMVLPSTPPTRQSTRMIKLVCPECGYLVRTTDKWIAVGLPRCPQDGADLEPPMLSGG